jgi:hypothetical protein
MPIARELMHFTTLSPEERVAAVRRLIIAGHGNHTIAQATRMTVEQIQQIRAGVARPSPVANCHGRAASARIDPSLRSQR